MLSSSNFELCNGAVYSSGSYGMLLLALSHCGSVR
jgi:hypothetical protein